jgi:glutamate-1-semialdehyde 2,1-aminomutase
VRAGFRLHAGGSHKVYPFTPDIACYCKALGNGYPISASVGNDDLKAAAGKVFLTGSYWNDGIALAAAKACLEIIERDNVPKQLEALGKQLLAGLDQAAKEVGITIETWGPPATPFMTFAGDPDLRVQQKFAGLCAQNGVLFHPHHNWFISLAHTEAAIQEAVSVAKQAFETIKADGIHG